MTRVGSKEFSNTENETEIPTEQKKHEFPVFVSTVCFFESMIFSSYRFESRFDPVPGRQRDKMWKPPKTFPNFPDLLERAEQKSKNKPLQKKVFFAGAENNKTKKRKLQKPLNPK